MNESERAVPFSLLMFTFRCLAFGRFQIWLFVPCHLDLNRDFRYHRYLFEWMNLELIIDTIFLTNHFLVLSNQNFKAMNKKKLWK